MLLGPTWRPPPVWNIVPDPPWRRTYFESTPVLLLAALLTPGLLVMVNLLMRLFRRQRTHLLKRYIYLSIYASGVIHRVVERSSLPCRQGEFEFDSPLEEYPTLVGGGGCIFPSPSQGEGLGVRSIHPGASATPQEGNKNAKIIV